MSDALSEIVRKLDEAIDEANAKVKAAAEELFRLKQAREKLSEGARPAHSSNGVMPPSSYFAGRQEAKPASGTKRRMRTFRHRRTTAQKVLEYLSKCQTPRTVAQIANSIGAPRGNITPCLYVWNKEYFKKVDRVGMECRWTTADNKDY